MICIVGGGLAGLSAAWELERSGEVNYAVLEAAPRAGGVAQSELRGGFLLEQGPDSFLARKPAAAELCREAGLAADGITPLPAPGSARILYRGRFEPIPAGWRMLEPGRLGPVLRSSLFSPGAKLALALRWRRRNGLDEAAEPDETVAAWLYRRYGPRAGGEILARLAAPMLAGVFGGDAAQLVRAAVQPPASGPQFAAGPVFQSLRRGMGLLPEALAAALAPRLRLQCRVRALRAIGAGYRLELESGEALEAEAVILALPAWAAAELLQGLDPALAAPLAAIPCASSVNLNLAWRQAPPLPPGTGFLVPRGERLRMLACTFAHQKFAHRAPPGAALLRVFYGEAEAGWPEPQLAELACQELRAALGIAAPPDFVQVNRWPRALPQYTAGHARRLGQIRAALACHSGLALAGNAYHGVGVPDCIASGRAAARAICAGAAQPAQTGRP